MKRGGSSRPCRRRSGRSLCCASTRTLALPRSRHCWGVRRARSVQICGGADEVEGVVGVNEFDDLDQLERELGPALRVTLRRVAADVPDDASAWSPGPIAGLL